MLAIRAYREHIRSRAFLITRSSNPRPVNRSDRSIVTAVGLDVRVSGRNASRPTLQPWILSDRLADVSNEFIQIDEKHGMGIRRECLELINNASTFEQPIVVRGSADGISRVPGLPARCLDVRQGVVYPQLPERTFEWTAGDRKHVLRYRFVLRRPLPIEVSLV